jgi:hypothetical protein
MSLTISEHTESRLSEEARRHGLSIEALLEQLIDERAGGKGAPQLTKPVFEQGLGMFGSPENAALMDEVVSLAYADRRQPGKDRLPAL